MHRDKVTIPKEVLIKKYVKEKKSWKAIAKELGYSTATVHNIGREAGIISRPTTNNSKRTRIRIPKKVLHLKYVIEHKSWEQIGSELGYSAALVWKLGKEYGIISRKPEIEKAIKKGIEGQIFGCVTVNKFSHLTRKGSRIWECGCDCGTIRYISTESLVLSYKRCHCKSKRHRSVAGFGSVPAWYLNKIRRSADKRGLEFSVSAEYLNSLFNGYCKLSGGPIKLFKSPEPRTVTTASLDRIDSSLGYVKGNVQWIDKRINKIKQDIANDEFIDICRMIANHN